MIDLIQSFSNCEMLEKSLGMAVIVRLTVNGIPDYDLPLLNAVTIN